MKVLLFANTDWYLYNFRLPLACALRNGGAEVVLISPSGPYGSKLEAQGFRWIPLPMDRRSLNPMRELKLLWSLLRVYRRERPDVVHHFTIKCVVYGSLVARILGVRRRINAVAGMGYVFSQNDLRARLLRPLVRVLLKPALSGRHSRLILQNTDDCAAFENARLVRSSQLRLIRGSGVNTERFQPRIRSRAQESTFRVIFAARLLWDKGIAEYVEASRQLRQAGLNIEFLVAGSPDPGNPSAVPITRISAWSKEGLITLLGHVDDIASWLNEVDVAVLPSYYREGVPRILIEAAASGLPAVTTDAPGCRDIVEHGVNGLLVPPRDVGALVSAIEWLYAHPCERRQMGIAGRHKVLQQFDEQIVLRKT